MRLQVQNIGGCKEADLSLEPGQLAWIGGLNESGKSSLLLSLLALLRREPNPAGRDARSLASYATDGNASAAQAQLAGPGWLLRWQPGEREVTAQADGEAQPPAAIRPLAADPGLLDLSGAAAAKEWTRLLRAEIDPQLLEERLRDAFTDLLKPEATAKATAAKALDPALGWDAAARDAASEARRAKAQWAEIVAEDGQSEKWGAAKAAEWKPSGWTADCASLTIAEAEERAAAAAEAHRKAEGQVYISQEQIERRNGLVADLERVKAEGLTAQKSAAKPLAVLREARQAYAAAEAQRLADRKWNDRIANGERDLAEVQAKLAKYAPQADAEAAERRRKEAAEQAAAQGGNARQCPHCGQWLRVDGQEIAVAAAAPPPAQPAPAAEAGLAEQVAAWRERERDLQAKLDSSRGVKREIKDLPERPPAEESIPEMQRVAELAAKKTALEAQIGLLPTAERASAEIVGAHELEQTWRDTSARLDAVRLHARALDKHKEACNWLAAKKILDPQGLRSEVYGEKVKKFNRRLASFCQAAGPAWERSAVALEPTRWAVKVGGRPVALASRSGKWRAYAALAAMLALEAGSPILPLDDLDTLVGIERPRDTLDGALSACRQLATLTGLAIVLCGAMPAKPRALDGGPEPSQGLWPDRAMVAGVLE